VLLVLLGLIAFNGPAVAAPGESQVPIDNPDLALGCGIDISVVLDESSSIASAGATEDVRRAFRAFVQALNNTGSRMAVSEFSTVARLPLPGAAARNYTTVTNATATQIFNPYITNDFNPNGRTNWEDGFRVPRYFLPRPSQDIPHLTVFITDGDPNEIIREDRVTFDPGNPNLPQNEYELKVPLDESTEVTSASATDAKNRAVPNANAIKATGSHVLAVAVGNALGNQDSLNRLIAVSGPDVFDGTGLFDITTDDVYRVPNFADLEDALREAAFQLCAPSVNVRKLIDLTPDPGTDDLIPAPDWDMTATATPTPADWVLPPTGTGDTATSTTGADGFVNFQWTTATPTDSTVDIDEEDPAGVPPGFENDPSATECTFRTPDQPTDQPLDIDTRDGGFTATVPDEAIVTCRMVNRAPPDPSVDIEKSTNGVDADDPPGPFIPITDPDGNPTVINWTYDVTNTGNVTLSGIDVTDDQGVDVSCPNDTLGPGASMTCTATGTAQSGQYANLGTVTGTDPFDTEVSDEDPSHYVGVSPGIDVEKSTNGLDADLAPGPFIPVGDPVNWTYVITNTGDTNLVNVVLDDDQLGTIDCDIPLLVPNDTATCNASGTAQPGLYENVATATGTDTLGQVVQDSDPSHYFGEDPSVDIEKSVNRNDADDPPGVFIEVGKPVAWTYQVTNTGNVPLRWEVTDDQLGAVACPRLLFIFPGQTVFCFGGLDSAEPGLHTNVGTVVGTSPSGTTVEDDDPANYFGVQGAIDLEKLTNGDDADEAPGPFVPVGSPVTWTYRVTNTGNSQLNNVVVSELAPAEATIDCPQDTLDVDESMDCTVTGTADPGQYENLAKATGETPVGTEVLDTDPSHYFGAAPGILLQKSTNGADANDPPGPFIPVGDQVTWTYTVSNTGNNTLTGITVTDDQGVTVDCPQDTLGPQEQMDCTATGTSVEGNYENNATATGTDPGGTEVTDDDPSHYFGSISKIRIKKFTNGHDANDPPGPQIPVGDKVTWTYEVTNPGNVAIRDVEVKDNRGEKPRFVRGDANGNDELDPGETWIYKASGKANKGHYANRGSVTGLDVLENKLKDSDPSHYHAAEPLLVIKKSASKRKVRPGGVFGYKITVRNKGGGDAHQVRVCDTLPPEQHILRTDPRAPHQTDRTACWRIPVLRSHKSRTFRITAQVDQSSPPGKQRNVAVVKSKGTKDKTDSAEVEVETGGGECKSRGAVPGSRAAPTVTTPDVIARRC
jgi:uncharacterized repeat protein (TIGR01451 family)